MAAVIATVVTAWKWRQERWGAVSRPAPSPVSVLPSPLAEVSVILSYPRRDLKGLVDYSLSLPDRRARSVEWVGTILAALGRSPGESAVPALPADLHPRAVFFDERGDLFLDFSADEIDAGPVGVEMETLAIEALLVSVGRNIPGVTALKILIDGADRETLWGHVDIRRLFPIPHP
ncbi:MAG: GerMN domain-containing protein [Pseudomonadota bacterium]